jgi:hypothetical protein
MHGAIKYHPYGLRHSTFKKTHIVIFVPGPLAEPAEGCLVGVGVRRCIRPKDIASLLLSLVLPLLLSKSTLSAAKSSARTESSASTATAKGSETTGVTGSSKALATTTTTTTPGLVASSKSTSVSKR